MWGRSRRVTEYRMTIWISMTAEEEQAYRSEHGLGPDDPLRAHLADHIRDHLDGDGELTGWWSITRVR